MFFRTLLLITFLLFSPEGKAQKYDSFSNRYTDLNGNSLRMQISFSITIRSSPDTAIIFKNQFQENTFPVYYEGSWDAGDGDSVLSYRANYKALPFYIKFLYHLGTLEEVAISYMFSRCVFYISKPQFL